MLGFGGRSRVGGGGGSSFWGGAGVRVRGEGVGLVCGG